jgi:hypothetical protein
VPFAVAILRSSTPTGLLVWCVIGLCAGVGLFFYGFRLLQRRRLILDTPMSKIRSASLGMVEISGLATGPYTLTAPVTQRQCYYYRTLVWEWKQSGKNKQWVKIAGECLHVPFFIEDATGLMLVDPRGADLDLHRDFQQEFNGSFFSSGDDAPASVNSFLALQGVATSNKIKVEEFCIKPKNAVFVLGTVAENSGLQVTPNPIREVEPIPSLSSAAFSLNLGRLSFSADPDSASSSVDLLGVHQGCDVVRLSSQAAPASSSEMSQQQKIAAALTKAGISSPAAWAVIGVSPDESSPAQVLNNSTLCSSDVPSSGAFVVHPAVVLQKGENNTTFLISWRSQQELARTLAWKCIFMIWGGPLLALLSLYVLLNMTKAIR